MRNEKRFLVERERIAKPQSNGFFPEVITCSFVAPIPLRAPQLQHQGSVNTLTSLRRKLNRKKEAADASGRGGRGDKVEDEI